MEGGGFWDELAALEQELAELRAREENESSTLAALEAETSKRRGELETVRVARADRERRVDEIRGKVRVAEEANEAYERSVVARDAAARSVTETIDRLLGELAELDGGQEEAEDAWATAEACAREAGTLSPARPRDARTDSALHESWERLRTEIRARSHEQFEDDLVDAAVHSPMGHAINDLPTHLRELARQRRSRLVQKLSQR